MIVTLCSNSLLCVLGESDKFADWKKDDMHKLISERCCHWRNAEAVCLAFSLKTHRSYCCLTGDLSQVFFP